MNHSFTSLIDRSTRRTRKLIVKMTIAMINITSHIPHHRFDHRFDLIDQTQTLGNISKTEYDTTGAALFIVVVLLWYAMGLFCMLGIQIRDRSETIEDFARRRAKLLIQTIHDQTQTKDILEELSNREKRAKLWDIYWGSSKCHPDQLYRAEHARIRKIKKQLAMIDRNRIIMNDTFVSPTLNRPSPSSDSQLVAIANLVVHV